MGTRVVGYTSKSHAEETQAITADEVAAALTQLPAAGHFAVQVKATALTASLKFEACVDSTNWEAVELFLSTDMTDTSLTDTLTNPTAGLWVTKVPMAVWGFRCRADAWTSQTAATMTVRWTRA